jgi:hypothetical protein
MGEQLKRGKIGFFSIGTPEVVPGALGCEVVEAGSGQRFSRGRLLKLLTFENSYTSFLAFLSFSVPCR